MICADSPLGSWAGSVEIDELGRGPEAVETSGVELLRVGVIDELLDELRHAAADEDRVPLTFEHQMPGIAEPLHDLVTVLRWCHRVARARKDQDGPVAAERGVEVGGHRAVWPNRALRLDAVDEAIAEYRIGV